MYKATINALKKKISHFGLPQKLVSDNGPPFSSKEFMTFCSSNGIEVLKSSPYNPESNGIAERAVQTVKRGINKFLIDHKTKKLSLQEKLDNFLFKYRNTPTTTTNVTPADIMFRYKPRTLIDLFKSEVNSMYDQKIQLLRKQI